MSNHVAFIIPGLIDPVPALNKLPNQELPELSQFSTLLSRAKWTTPESLNNSDNSLYDCILNQLTLTSQSAPKPPAIASVCYYFDREKYASEQNSFLNDSDLKGKWIMRVDPCFITPDRDQLVMAKTQNMNISMPEAKLLVDTINKFFSAFAEEQFWKLYAVSPERWYIVSNKPINIQTTSPEKVLGQSLKTFLLTGEDSQHWLNLFNEWQMILHQSPVNKQRMAAKKLPVNSVWFWGTGQACQLPFEVEKLSKPESQAIIYSNNVYTKGLAKLLSQEALDLPEDYQTVSENHAQRYIYVIEDFMQAINNRDIFTWVGLLEQFGSNYLQPLLQDIKSGRVKQVEFISPSGTKLLLTRKLLRRWWRKKQTYYSFLT